MKKEEQAYLLARLPIGLSFFGHGIVRIPKLNAFVEGMSKGFVETWLPISMVKVFATALPFIELLLGLALVLGVKMKETTTIGVGLICLLIAGSALQENWSAVAIQMFYGIYMATLFLFSQYNKGII